mmetsp:Transcript_8017/g.29160  ORF Transcript_8017/g.29160 Transcript_8017/m.29160 type:complete len:244 (+) Transcript_8017:210-941(+)
MPSLLLLCTSLLEGLHALHHRLLHAVRPRRPIWRGAGAPVHGRRRQLMIHREFLQCRRIMPIGIFDALEVEVDIAAPELLLVLTRSLVTLDLGHKVLLAVKRDRPSGGPRARCRQPRPLRCGGHEAAKVGGEACGARQASGLLSEGCLEGSLVPPPKSAQNLRHAFLKLIDFRCITLTISLRLAAAAAASGTGTPRPDSRCIKKLCRYSARCFDGSRLPPPLRSTNAIHCSLEPGSVRWRSLI